MSGSPGYQYRCCSRLLFIGEFSWHHLMVCARFWTKMHELPSNSPELAPFPGIFYCRHTFEDIGISYSNTVSHLWEMWRFFKRSDLPDGTITKDRKSKFVEHLEGWCIFFLIGPATFMVVYLLIRLGNTVQINILILVTTFVSKFDIKYTKFIYL